MPSKSKSGVKKLVFISATSTLVTGTREETVEAAESIETAEVDKDGKESKGEYSNLARVPCIWYSITLRKKSVSVSTLFDSGSEVNAIHPTFAWELGLPIRPTDIGAEKINSTMLDTYGMVVITFLVTDKANQVRFFEKTFLLVNISPEIVFGMPFLTLSGADVDFFGRELCWRTYTTKKALQTTRGVELVSKKKFAAATLDPEYEAYIVHVRLVSSNALPSFSPLNIHPFRRPQISGLIVEETPTKVPAKYSYFTDVFSPDLTSELLKHTGINNHAIKLVDDQQLPYRPIYSLGPMELETLKAYIETNLANG